MSKDYLRFNVPILVIDGVEQYIKEVGVRMDCVSTIERRLKMRESEQDCIKFYVKGSQGNSYIACKDDKHTSAAFERLDQILRQGKVTSPSNDLDERTVNYKLGFKYKDSALVM